MAKPRHKSLKEAILANIKIAKSTGCWIWQLSLVQDRHYGRLTYKGKAYSAHRAAYEAFVGEIPKGLHICHKCNNPSCCNPEHLYAGTHYDNMQDRKKAGGYTKSPKKKLTKEICKSIRDDNRKGLPVIKITKMYGLSKTTINRVLRNEIYPDSDFVRRKSRKDNIDASIVKEIRKLHRSGLIQADICARFGLDARRVADIIKNIYFHDPDYVPNWVPMPGISRRQTKNNPTARL